MADPNQPATEEAPEANSSTQESTPTIPSLEDIAREFSVDDLANQFTAQPSASQKQSSHEAPIGPSVPDPIVDAEGYRAYMAQQAALSNQFSTSLNTIQQRLERFEQAQQQQKIESDLKLAVTKVNEKLKVDPMLAEIALEKMYRSDSAFKRIWDNRERNPAAYEKALDAVSHKLAPMFAVRQDPQLTENQRAARASTKTAASQARRDFDPQLKGLYEPDSQAEFEATWNRLKRG